MGPPLCQRKLLTETVYVQSLLMPIMAEMKHAFQDMTWRKASHDALYRQVSISFELYKSSDDQREFDDAACQLSAIADLRITAVISKNSYRHKVSAAKCCVCLCLPYASNKDARVEVPDLCTRRLNCRVQWVQHDPSKRLNCSIQIKMMFFVKSNIYTLCKLSSE